MAARLGYRGNVARRPQRGPGVGRLAVVVIALALAPPARAGDCAPESTYSTCFDADARWLSPPSAPFLGVAGAVPLAAGHHRLGAAIGWLERPVVLALPSPDPTGRELRVVDRIVSLTLLESVALGSRATFDGAIPLTLAQQGAGMESVTSLAPAPAPRVLRDPRAGFTLGLARRQARVETALAARYVVVLPLGDERTLGGERGLVGAPSLAVEGRGDHFFAGAEAGVRLRMAVQVGDTRLGTSLVGAAGVGWDPLRERRLTLTAEAVAAPVLVRQPAVPERLSGRWVVPAEWLVAVGSQALGRRSPAVMLGVGAGIPLSSAPPGFDATGPRSAVTTPRLRAVFTVRQELGPRRREPPAAPAG